MPYDVDALDFRKGDPLLAEQLQAIVEELRRPSAAVRGGAGLTVRRGARGAVQVTGSSPTRFVGVANGAISRRSGTTWGSGTVTRYTADGATTGVDYAVVNPSSTAMTSGNGIDSGQYCWVAEDDDGNMVVTPLECS